MAIIMDAIKALIPLCTWFEKEEALKSVELIKYVISVIRNKMISAFKADIKIHPN